MKWSLNLVYFVYRLVFIISGQDRHIGMKAPPHELVLENSILSMDNFPPVRVRVSSESATELFFFKFLLDCFVLQTPPRSITVDTISNGHDHSEPEEEVSEAEDEENPNKELVLIADKSSNSSSLLMSDPPQLPLTAPQLTEEVFVLRQQIARLHRRMTGIEREQQQRQQRDALVVSLGTVYLVWKVILWLTRSP